MRGLGEKAVMFCSYISWVVINVLSDWEMNEVFLERTRPINFFSFKMYMFSNFVPLSHLCCVAGPLMIEIVICLNLSGYVQRCIVTYLDPRKPTKFLSMEMKQNNTIKCQCGFTIAAAYQLCYAIFDLIVISL